MRTAAAMRVYDGAIRRQPHMAIDMQPELHRSQSPNPPSRSRIPFQEERKQSFLQRLLRQQLFLFPQRNRRRFHHVIKLLRRILLHLKRIRHQHRDAQPMVL